MEEQVADKKPHGLVLRQKQQWEDRAPFPAEFKLNSDLFQQGLHSVSMTGCFGLADVSTGSCCVEAHVVVNVINKMVWLVTNCYMYEMCSHHAWPCATFHTRASYKENSTLILVVAFCIYCQYLVFTILLFQPQLLILLLPMQLNLDSPEKLPLSVIKDKSASGWTGIVQGRDSSHR